MDKHSSLLRKFVNYGRKKFYSIGPWRAFKMSSFIESTKPDAIEENLSILFQQNLIVGEVKN
jgi:hypothetical protein